MQDDSFTLFEELLEDAEVIEALNSPTHMISGSGWGWYLDPDVNQMVKTRRGTEVVPVPKTMDEHDRILVRSAYRYLLIPVVEVEVVGWN